MTPTVSRRRRVAALLVVAASIAACTSGNDVSTDQVDPIDSTSSTAIDDTAGPDDTALPPDDPATGLARTTPPDPSALPPLGDLDPDTRTGVLDNGLRYLLRENDNPGAKVEFRLVIDAGSGLEDDDQVGGAHFLEHMLFNGTEQFPKNELIAVLRSFGAGFGADINAYTSYDETVYQLTTPNDPEVVGTALDVLQQWLSAATIATEDVRAERGIVLDEWRVRDQTADGRVFEQIADLFLAGTAYDGHAPIGGAEAIESTEAAPLRRFYDDWYRPDNAAVIVVGDVDLDTIERGIAERFSSATARGDARDRPPLTVSPPTETVARVVTDPDLAEGFAFVTLPTSTTDFESPEAQYQWELLEALAFDVVATRLNDDARRGEAPFDSARVDSSAFVRDLSAPEILVDVDGPAAADAVQAVVDEYERVRRHGVTPAELERAVGAVRSAAQQTYDGRNSRQDASFADEYVDHVLLDEPYVTADREFEFVSAVLDGATPETVGHVFVDRYERAGAHVFVAAPASEADALPTEAELITVVEGAADRDIDPRGGEVAAPDRLMARPDPVGEAERTSLAPTTFTPLLDPLVLTFPNGVRVSLNTTDIVEGSVFFEGRSPGGLALVTDADVPDADAVGTVIAESGVGDLDRVTLDAFLDGREVSLSPFVDQFEERLFGEAATTDLEALFALVHLTMTDPVVDPIALDRYVDDELRLAENPEIDSGYAEFKALRDARYDDVRFLLPTPETLATVDAEGIERVMADRFGDAGDWVFAFSGDFDLDEGIELARAYLGTLPASGRTESTDYVEPPPPPGVVRVDAVAGEGEQATVSFLFTAEGSPDRRDDVLAQVVTEVLTNRLTDSIREELGESYSPFGRLSVGAGATPPAELYVSVSTGPELVEEVSAAVIAQLDDLRANGPTEPEFAAASTTVEERLGFVNNNQINAEALAALVDPVGNASFEDYVYEFELVATIGRDDVTEAIRRWVDTERYIEVRVGPRG